MTLPADLVPLPTSPWDTRPAELPLEVEECRTAVWKTRGNISKAAEILKVSSMRLRNFVNKSPYLLREVQEAQEQLLDAAEDVVYDALMDVADPGRRDSMARFILPQLGASRGYGTKGGGVQVNLPGGSKGVIQISWADGESLNSDTSEDDGTIIEGTAVAK